MEDLVTITVDDIQMQVPKGTLLWEAAAAHGIDIPIFCYHTKLGPVGACRTCLVEIVGGPPKPATACSTPVTDGMVVRTKSPVAQKAQRGIFEFLLANHPLDCPICDRAGECPLQDQTFSFGPGTSRYVEPKRHHVKPIALGPTIALDRERCVLCWRCVRFCAEIAEDKSIVLLDRGDHTVVGTFQDEQYVSNFSGNVVELCPVGALTSRKQRFNFRPWELQNRPSVCPHCAMGCNINVSVRKNDEVIRFLSRDNPDIDDSWLCDRGRFNFEFINSPDRLTSPMLRQGDGFVQVSWSHALDYISQRLLAILGDEEAGGSATVAGVASPRLTNEDLFVFKRFMRDVIGTERLDHFPRPLAGLTAPQRQAQATLDAALGAIADFGRAKTIVLLGADPSVREPVMELRIRQAVNRHGARLVVLSPDAIALSSKASATSGYPAGQFTAFVSALSAAVAGEKDGQFTGLADLASGFLAEGPIVLVYDDAFPDATDKGAALEAVASLVSALAPRGLTVIPLLDDCNSMGARQLQVLPSGPDGGSWGPSVLEQLGRPGSGIRAALLFGVDPMKDLPDPAVAGALEQLELLVVSELFMTETARAADVILPAASFAEKIGTFTNTEGRVQAIAQTVPSPGIARADWEMLVDLSQYFERPLDYSLPRQIWEDIRRETRRYAGVSYDDLGSRGVRAAALQPV